MSAPPLRKGTPRRRASAARPKIASVASGVPKVGAPLCIDIELRKLPKITGDPGRQSWPRAMPAMASASVCAIVPADRDRRHRARQDEGRDQEALVRAGIDLERAQHGRVEGHRRVGVDQADHDGLGIDHVRAEEDFRQLHRICRALGVRDRAHEGLVGKAHVRVDHVEVALVDRHVDRLADRASRVVHRRRHVGELDDVLEILELRVAAPLLDVVDEGRAIDRREDRVAAAHFHRSLGIAGKLREGGRRGRDQMAREPARKAHPFAVDVGAGILEERERFRVVAKVDPDLFQDRVRVLLDQGQPLFGQQPEPRGCRA